NAGADDDAYPLRILVLHRDAGILEGEPRGANAEASGPTHHLHRLPHGARDEWARVEFLDLARDLDGERRGIEGHDLANAATSVDAGVPELVLTDAVGGNDTQTRHHNPTHGQ